MALFTWPSPLAIIMFILPKLTSKPTYLYHLCYNDTTFATNSQHHTNLNTVLHYLYTNATANPTGFFSSSAGTSTNQPVYGLFLCRGDQNATTCNDCVSTAASSDLGKKYCPDVDVGVVWYEECMVRYSITSISGIMHQAPSVQFWNETNITGNKTRFSDVLGSAMNDVAVRASKGSNGKKYATSIVNVTKSMKLYTLGQCTPDLSIDDCNLCLRIGIGLLQVMVDGGVFMPSCIVRFATYPFFYNENDLFTPAVPTNLTVGEGRGKKKALSKMIIVIVVPIAAILVAVLALLYIIRNRSINKYSAFAKNNGDNFTTVESLQYELVTLQNATDYFSHQNKLGQGGFGVVYKGTLQSGEEIAVKRLTRDSGQAQEFKNEVLLVAKLQHRNLARLLGFCVDGQEKLLVYEYVANKSLDCFLFDDAKRRLLNWDIRYKIIVGVARGMLYLHQDSRPRIIHRDLKVSNILLDMDMNPKVADFGMARMFSVDQSHGNTIRIVGTYGYMSPEYAMQGQFSVKSDVYSFGVLVLEIVSGKRNSTFYETGYAEDLLSYVWKKWKDGVALDIVDPTITCSKIEVTRCIQLGLLCVQQSSNKRPTMATIVHKLDVGSSALPFPQQPAFFAQNRGISDHANMDIMPNRINEKPIPWSVNDMSISNIEPR